MLRYDLCAAVIAVAGGIAASYREEIRTLGDDRLADPCFHQAISFYFLCLTFSEAEMAPSLGRARLEAVPAEDDSGTRPPKKAVRGAPEPRRGCATGPGCLSH